MNQNCNKYLSSSNFKFTSYDLVLFIIYYYNVINRYKGVRAQKKTTRYEIVTSRLLK